MKTIILQNVAVLYWFYLLTFSAPVYIILSFYIIFYTNYNWVILLYLIWLYIDRHSIEQGGRRYEWMCNLPIWKHFMDYFPITIKCSNNVVLEANKNYLFCCYPHGILSIGTFAAFCTNKCGTAELFPNHKVYNSTLNINFYIPIRREVTLAHGAISVSKKSIKYILNKKGGGNIAVLVPGGAKESYLSKPGEYIFYYEERKGFVKLALESGTALVPVIKFGENDLYNQFEYSGLMGKIQAKIESLFGFAFVIPIGIGFLPLKKPLDIIVGRPMEIPLIASPSIEVINKFHADFKLRLIELFEEHKHKYVENFENTKLIFV